MSHIILDSDEDEEVSVEELSASAYVVERPSSDPASARRDSLSTAQSSIRPTSSSENLRRQIYLAQSALIEPTPDGKRNAADELDVFAPAQLCSHRKERSESVGPDGSYKKGKLKPLSKGKKPSHRSNGVARLEDEWEVPAEQAAGPEAAIVTSPTCIVVYNDRYERAQMSPSDTIMDSSSLRCDASSRHALVGEEDGGFASHNPNELFPDPSNESSKTASTSRHEAPGASESFVGPRLQQDTNAVDMAADVDAPAFKTDELQVEQAAAVTRLNLRPEKTADPVVIVDVKDTDSHKQNDPGQKSQRGKKRKADRESSVDELNFEEVIGLPKETYNPRPTRSRGARKGPDEAVFALPATPAKKSNSKLKRLRTTGSIALAERTTLCEMGFRPSQAEQALAEADGDLNGAVELLTSRGYEVSKTPHTKTKSTKEKLSNKSSEQMEPQQDVASPPGTRKRMARSTVLVEDEEEGPVNVIAMEYKATGVDEHKATEEAVRSRGSTATKVRQPQDTVLELGEEASQEESGKPRFNAVQANGEKHSKDGMPAAVRNPEEMPKRGRGRPRKLHLAADENPDREVIADEIPEECTPLEPLREVDANSKNPEASVRDDARASTSTSATEHDEKATAEKPTPASKSPRKPHSPLNSSKVPYKVGLSRRARIEPLLRIVRK